MLSKEEGEITALVVGKLNTRYNKDEKMINKTTTCHTVSNQSSTQSCSTSPHPTPQLINKQNSSIYDLKAQIHQLKTDSNSVTYTPLPSLRTHSCILKSSPVQSYNLVDLVRSYSQNKSHKLNPSSKLPSLDIPTNTNHHLKSNTTKHTQGSSF